MKKLESLDKRLLSFLLCILVLVFSFSYISYPPNILNSFLNVLIFILIIILPCSLIRLLYKKTKQKRLGYINRWSSIGFFIGFSTHISSLSFLNPMNLILPLFKLNLNLMLAIILSVLIAPIWYTLLFTFIAYLYIRGKK